MIKNKEIKVFSLKLLLIYLNFKNYNITTLSLKTKSHSKLYCENILKPMVSPISYSYIPTLFLAYL